mmetsp:Transcript_20606/g.62049  ORF Transcript_20606/g.62049 Transcript_20606/m.62049 type:complete len:322 (+) Transcript_20606:156-1121(+)|eukprot:CAMPEP_0206134540 /NCGR_PEP_ID=MMETSP1473-20131121/66_1 /ASSEMBLY_ACC=CAM_ASM_001109 /TAXON_ID=1461547 /ORGANISM="Stichococcus sp, Strain RCC1054" /LENGTH=321 /DNA_ID=CAMNT_0053526155 /DNA_START=146 /DNA_END=1111 /DNA_ORIENTATION=+
MVMASSKGPNKRTGGSFPAWLPTAVVLGVVGLSLYAYTGQARSDPAGTGNPKAQEVINRFYYAQAHVQKLKEIGKNEMYPMTNCPEDFSLGYRTTPGQKVPEFAGNTCEPWIARYAVVFLDKLIDTDMNGLEWSTGSGTMWLLSRLNSLVSIEHHASWIRKVSQNLERIFPKKFFQKWELHVVEAKDFKTKALEEDYENFKDYVDAEFLPHTPTYDFVSVDGRARIHCMKRALPLVKPEGGIFMLDNSDREAYDEGYQSVPSHWLKFEDSVNTGERTTLWVTCLPGKCGPTTTSGTASTSTVKSSKKGKKGGKKGKQTSDE